MFSEINFFWRLLRNSIFCNTYTKSVILYNKNSYFDVKWSYVNYKSNFYDIYETEVIVKLLVSFSFVYN